MRAVSVMLSVVSCLYGGTAEADPETTAQGVWLRGDGNARVVVAPCGDKLCATNVWIRDPRSGEAVGDRLVMTVTAKPGGDLSGQAFDPKRDLTYSLFMTVAKDRLTTRGCVLGGLLCRSVSWSRAE